MWQESVYFPNCRGERLAGILHYPEDRPAAAVLILGPHPHLGGDLANNVVAEIASRLETLSALILRFDYHGNGESRANVAGHIYDYYERLERDKVATPFVDDALAARDYLVAAATELPLALVGYSFGGYLALKVRGNARLVALVAPALSGYPEIEDAAGVFCLKAGDDFVKNERMPAMDEEVLSGADHFFRGKEREVARWVLEKIKEIV